MSALRAHSRCIREDPFLVLLCPIAVIITRSSSGSYSGCGQVLLLRADGCPKVWVATSDSFHQQAAHGSVCELLTFSFKQRFALKDINL
jgi:hypothetical protein